MKVNDVVLVHGDDTGFERCLGVVVLIGTTTVSVQFHQVGIGMAGRGALPPIVKEFDPSKLVVVGSLPTA